MGVAPRRLWGWEPETTFTYVDDRLVSSRPEPEWNDRQYLLMSLLAEYEADLCPDCGQPRSECMDARADHNYRGADSIRYQGEAVRCYACEAMNAEAEKFETPDRARKFSVKRTQ